MSTFAERAGRGARPGYRDGAFYATHATEVTRITDTNADGRADRYDTVSDAWGFGHYHEYALGSKLDAAGQSLRRAGAVRVLPLEGALPGWALKITPDGRTIPLCSGLRSPLGVGANEHGEMFYVESQGPWNGSCSLKHLKPGGFMGHPISFNWYPFATNLGATPVMPNSPSRMETERERVKELVPYAVVFPYKKMGRSISGFEVCRAGGKFGPFDDQIFVGDYTLSVVMRATTEQVNGVWQGACYPFREGLGTGILNLHFTPEGKLITGGTNRGWPVRGMMDNVLQRLDWTGRTPFEILDVRAQPDGFHPALHPTRGRRPRRQPRPLHLANLHPRLPAGLRQPRGGPDHAHRHRRRSRTRRPQRAPAREGPGARATCTTSTCRISNPRTANGSCTTAPTTR